MKVPYVKVDEYGIRIIIENIIDQVYEQGWDTVILEEIEYVRRNPDVAIPTEEKAYKTINGIQLPVITKNGWDIQVKWIDQSTYWVPLHMINA